jgi:hypothetical protein
VEGQWYVESGLRRGFAYSVFDYFANQKFNMIYVQKIPDWEVKLRRNYLQALKAPTNKRSRDELLEMKKEKRDIKARIREEDKKRMDAIGRESVPLRCLRVMSNVGRRFVTAVDADPLAVLCPFNDEEIYIAKKCMLNKLSRPPNYYDFYDKQAEDKSNVSGGNAATNSNQQFSVVACSSDRKHHHRRLETIVRLLQSSGQEGRAVEPRTARKLDARHRSLLLLRQHSVLLQPARLQTREERLPCWGEGAAQ